MRFEPSTIS